MLNFSRIFGSMEDIAYLCNVLKILRGRDEYALPQTGGHFLCPTSYEIREYDICVPLP